MKILWLAIFRNLFEMLFNLKGWHKELMSELGD